MQFARPVLNFEINRKAYHNMYMELLLLLLSECLVQSCLDQTAVVTEVIQSQAPALQPQLLDKGVQ